MFSLQSVVEILLDYFNGMESARSDTRTAIVNMDEIERSNYPVTQQVNIILDGTF